MIPDETVRQIIDTARVEDVVGEYLTLKRRGVSLVACCPFHNEKTPSFYVTPSKGIYKCFGCGKAGGAVTFLMDYDHMSYADALKHLARKYHIEIKEEDVSEEELRARNRRESLMLVSEYAASFFAAQLKSGEGKAVGYSYFRSRSITDETISRFGLGWAPENRTALIDAAVAAGYKLEYLLDAGLAVRYEDGSVADKFRGRAMFPIYTVSGRVIAFSGRTLHSDIAAKYLNTADTDIYTKSKVLLGINFAKDEISRKKKCIVVEGNVDMVMMHQLGIRNVVAPCGTALTAEQVHLIHRFTEDLTIMFDGDSAGINSALGKINMVLEEGLDVRIVRLPDGEDPDSFCRSHSLEEVERFIAENERDFVDFKSELLLASTDDPMRKANLINDIADTIACIPDAVKRSVYAETVAEKFNMDSAVIFDRMQARRQKNLEEKMIREERERRREQAGLPALPEEDAGRRQVPTVENQMSLEDPIVAPAEKDLLKFLLMYGREILVFESDSEFYTGEECRQSVAEFISSSVSADGGSLVNKVYDKVYQRYMALYLSGMPQEGIMVELLNSPDTEVSKLSASLSAEKYELTVEGFRNSLTTKESWLVSFVPKAILVYTVRKIDSRLSAISRRISSVPEETDSLMAEMTTLQKVRKVVKNRMNRK